MSTTTSPDVTKELHGLSKDAKGVVADRLLNDVASVQGHAELILMYPDDERRPHWAQTVVKGLHQCSKDIRELFGLTPPADIDAAVVEAHRQKQPRSPEPTQTPKRNPDAHLGAERE